MIRRSLAVRAQVLARALDRELACARAQDLGWELERDLALALDCADALARALDPDQDPDPDHDLGPDLGFGLDLGFGPARGFPADSLALARNLACALARARNLACDRARARNLVRVLDRAHSRARHLVRALERELDRARNRHLIRALNRTRTLLRSLAGLARNRDATAPEPGYTGSAVGPVSRSLVAMAVQVLPAQHRDRYRDEFRAELHDLPNRWQRLGYALRVLSGAGDLRRALTGPTHTPEGTPARRTRR